MQGFLGEKIGEGAFADVHAWAPGQVLKLFKSGVPRRISWWEARMTRAVFAAGAPAAEVFDEVTVEERFGIVLRRFDGPTLLQLTRDRTLTPQQAAAILAPLYISVHAMLPPQDVPTLRDAIAGMLHFSGDRLPKQIATGIPAMIERLSPGDGLCHGDLHTGNVIMTVDGPRVIDWISTVRAPAGFDLACCHLVHTELIPEGHEDPERPRAVNAAVPLEYARLAGMSLPALTAAIESYLPIARVFYLLGGAGSAARRERLTRCVAAAL